MATPEPKLVERLEIQFVFITIKLAHYYKNNWSENKKTAFNTDFNE